MDIAILTDAEVEAVLGLLNLELKIRKQGNKDDRSTNDLKTARDKIAAAFEEEAPEEKE